MKYIKPSETEIGERELLLRMMLAIFNIPLELFAAHLDALRLEAEITGRPDTCIHRTCRRSGKCKADQFDGINHPCGIAWTPEILTTMMMMMAYHTNQLEKDVVSTPPWF